MKTRAKIRVLGVMTGTSCDGMDAACLEISQSGWKALWAAKVGYPASLRARVLSAQKPAAQFTSLEWLKLNRDLGDWYATSISTMIRNSSPKPDLIANHGQTLAHFPAAENAGMTMQLGDPSRIAFATGITTVSNFRDGDMAAGGEGAPLVPLFHSLLAHVLDPKKQGIAIHNIGGISNLTYVSPQGDVLAFDTGPGNIWIDAAAEKVTEGRRKMDLGGKLAAQGRVDWAAVTSLLKHPYFKRSAPKSTGRDEFPSELFFSKLKNREASPVATATALTIESIAQAYEQFVLKKKHPLKSIFFCGGGAKNGVLMEALAERLNFVEVRKLEDYGLNPELIEAQAFAYFGYLALNGVALGGKWTGAQGFAPPAHIIPGKNWRKLIQSL